MRFFQGAAIDRIVFEIIHSKYSGPYSSITDPSIQFDFVMCLGHFLSKVVICVNVELPSKIFKY